MSIYEYIYILVWAHAYKCMELCVIELEELLQKNISISFPSPRTTNPFSSAVHAETESFGPLRDFWHTLIDTPWFDTPWFDNSQIHKSVPRIWNYPVLGGGHQFWNYPGLGSKKRVRDPTIPVDELPHIPVCSHLAQAKLKPCVPLCPSHLRTHHGRNLVHFAKGELDHGLGFTGVSYTCWGFVH